LTTPFDTVKTKATLDFVGCSFWDSAMLTIQDHGPEALFCGAAARVAWLIPVTAIYLPTYDLIKTKVQEHHHQTIQSSKVDAMDSQR
jgi:Mitochondrial carrier protein